MGHVQAMFANSLVGNFAYISSLDIAAASAPYLVLLSLFVLVALRA